MPDQTTFSDRILDFEGSYSLFFYAGDFGDPEREFASAGIIPNGYAWEALAVALIEAGAPGIVSSLEFDSEAGAFCARSADRVALEMLATLLARVCSDREALKSVVARLVPRGS